MKLRLLASCVVLSSLIVFGCNTTTTPPKPNPDFLPNNVAKSSFQGFSYDPEALFFSLVTCQDCGGPLLLEFDMNFQRSSVVGTGVKLVQPDLTTVVATSAAPSDEHGLWNIGSFDAQPEVYVQADGMGQLADFPTDAGPAIPPSAYLPTFTVRPINAEYSTCFAQEAPVIGKNGILEATAKALSEGGSAVTVDDLVNPAKYGGVVVLWAYAAADNPLVRVPADGIEVSHDKGTLVFVDWAPSDALPPEALPFQSARGFIADPHATATPAGGIAVLLLPPATTPTTVSFKFKDTVEDQEQGRPWLAHDITAAIPPGMVSFAPVLMQFPGIEEAEPLPRWICYTEH